jgi:hypothetical protein
LSSQAKPSNIDIQYQFNFRLIDTPGFNDNSTGDEYHAMNIIRRLQHFPSITAVLFIVGKGTTYSQSFLNMFRLYKAILRGLRFVIVHTKWDPLDPNVTDQDYTARKVAFQSLLSEHERDEVNFQHFFIDTVPGRKSPRNPFFEHKRALGIEALDMIVGFLCAVDPTPTNKIQFVKTPRMKHLDACVYFFFLSYFSSSV